MSSGVVSAGSSSSSAAARASSNEVTPDGRAPPSGDVPDVVTRMCRRRGHSLRISSTFGSSGALTTIATARLSRRMYARSREMSSVFVGTGIAPSLIAPKNA